MNQTAETQTKASEDSLETTNGFPLYPLGLGIALATGGQVVLLMIKPNSTNGVLMQVLALVMLIAGGILFGLSTHSYRFDQARLKLPKATRVVSRHILQSLWSRIWFLLAAVLAAGAIGLFSIQGENLLVIFLWLASILTLFLSQFQARQLAFPHLEREEGPYLVGLGLLLIVALVTRVYHLTTLPYNFDGDFASVGLEARALGIGQQQHIFALGWADLPMLGYSPAWFSMKLFGTGLTGLNASGVMEGLLILVGVYLLGRDLFQPRVGLLAAAMLTVSYAHLAASRESVYIDPVVFMLFAIYFLLIGMRQEKGWMLVASGLLTAFCFQLYYSGRLIIPIILSILFFYLIFYRIWLWQRRRLNLLWGLAVLISLGPMLLVFMRTPDGLIARTREVFILNPDVVKHMEGVFHVNTIPTMLLDQLQHTILLFHYFPDKGTQFGLQLPFLDPFTATLFTLGLGYSIFHLRSLGGWLLAIWIALGLLIGGVLTVNPPFWPRLMVLLPPCAILAAITLNFLYELLQRLFMRLNIRKTAAASLIVVLFLIGLGWRNWNLYVKAVGSYATPRTFIARYLAELPPETKAHLISSYFNYQDREFEFLAPGYLVDNLTPGQVESGDLPLDSIKLLILSADEQSVVEQIQTSYPGATVETHMGNNPNEISFYVVHLP